MKVLVIHTAYKQKGGEDSVVENEIELLRSIGVEVSLLKFSNAEKTLQKVVQMIFNYGSYKKTIEAIDTYKPDIVHVHNLHFGGSPSVIYAINKRHIPIVITIHNYRMLCPSATLFFEGTRFTESINNSFSWNAIGKGVYQHSKALTFWLSCSMFLHQKLGTYNLASKFIALGDYTKEIFQNSKLKAIASNIIVKPNFCYSKSEFNQSTGDYYLYIGRLSEEKGIETLLQVFSENHLPLKIAGAGPLEQSVKDFSAKYPNIEYLNLVNKEGVDKLLEHAIALIFPSRWFETFGMVIIEAFAKSVPVIASNLGQLKVTIKDRINGLHFKAGNVKDMIRKIAYFQDLDDDQKRVYRRNAFASYGDLYTPQKNADQLMDIYHKVINGSLR